MKKTVQIRDLIERANEILALPNVSQEKKEMLSRFVENFMHKCGVYAGYTYNTPYERGNGHERDITYFIHHKLRDK